MNWRVEYYTGLPLTGFSSDDGNIDDAPRQNIVWIIIGVGPYTHRLQGFDFYYLRPRQNGIWEVGGWYTTSDTVRTGSGI